MGIDIRVTLYFRILALLEWCFGEDLVKRIKSCYEWRMCDDRFLSMEFQMCVRDDGDSPRISYNISINISWTQARDTLL